MRLMAPQQVEDAPTDAPAPGAAAATHVLIPTPPAQPRSSLTPGRSRRVAVPARPARRPVPAAILIPPRPGNDEDERFCFGSSEDIERTSGLSAAVQEAAEDSDDLPTGEFLKRVQRGPAKDDQVPNDRLVTIEQDF